MKEDTNVYVTQREKENAKVGWFLEKTVEIAGSPLSSPRVTDCESR